MLSWEVTPVGSPYYHNRHILLPRYNDSLLDIVDYIFHQVAFSLDALILVLYCIT